MMSGLPLVKSEDPALPFQYVLSEFRVAEGPQGLPLVKPPYGRVTAIDLNTGEHLWVRPSGEGPRDHPALAGLDLPQLGWPSRTFVLRTPSLLFTAQEGPFEITGFSPRGNAMVLETSSRNPSLRAHDPATSELIAEIPLPANASGSPMTYLVNGTQYIAIPIGGTALRAELVTLRLRQ